MMLWNESGSNRALSVDPDCKQGVGLRIIEMVKLIEDKRKELVSLCQKHRVERLELFGSALTGENFDIEKSDIDFLVEFLPLEPGTHAHTYFGLLDDLRSLFQRKVNLVMTCAIKNRYFLESINQNRKVLYAA